MALIVTSPVAGRTISLEAVPDPVFAQRMMGDGVAIQPLGDTIYAPFDGEIVTLHDSAHAVAVRGEGGAEILVHIGLDTVALKGEGFTPLVSVGDRVSRGDPLIRFDLDGVALAATSLVTPIILTNTHAFAIARRTLDRTVGTSEELMAIVPVGTADSRPSDGAIITDRVTLSLPHGIHARPAARLGECVRAFRAEVSLVHQGKRADTRSVVALLGLGTRFGDEVTLEARGEDAEAALMQMAALLGSSMGEVGAPPAESAQAAPAILGAGQIRGVIASPGLGTGPAARLREAAIKVVREGGDVERESSALTAARNAVRQRIETRAAVGGDTVASIMDAHLAMLDDPQLVAASEAAIGSGSSAAFAWRSAVREQVKVLLQSGNAHLAERTGDLEDIERQVLTALSGGADHDQMIPKGAILIADDLLPSQLVSLAEGGLAGICLAKGGPTSHVSILCAGFGIPALVAMGEALSSIEEGASLLLDADAGLVTVAPSPAAAEAFTGRIKKRQARRASAHAAASDECRTADGTRIEFFANLASVAEARAAAGQGAEGCGLVRSEFLFLGRNEPPSEDEQHASYQGICDALPGLPVIVRLLDVGGDKPAAYIPIEREENPALGLRGIRVSFAYPDLLDTQIRAILRVGPASQCRIMIPMVTSVDEVRSVRKIVNRLRGDLGIPEPVEVGVMIETPAAAATADLLASEADFLSIGTNDLAQYVLAMDRGNPAVAAGVDAMHPAVLRTIAQTCQLATGTGRWVGVCGGLASDPAALPILVGLGVTELSSVPDFVPEGKAIVRSFTMAEAVGHAARALQCQSPAEVRTLAGSFAEGLR